MAQDHNGKELKIGDEIIVKARIVEIHKLVDESLLQVEWNTKNGALLDFVKASVVEKNDDSKSKS